MSNLNISYFQEFLMAEEVFIKGIVYTQLGSPDVLKNKDAVIPTRFGIKGKKPCKY
jgi:hypothetical protein